MMTIGRIWAKTWPMALYVVAVGSSAVGFTRFSAAPVALRCLSVPLAIVSFIALVFFLNLRHRRAARRSAPEHSGGADVGLNLKGLIERQRAAVREENLGAIPNLVHMITQPSDFRTRTAETISVQGLVTEQLVSVEFAFPHESIRADQARGMDELYVPVLVPRKQETTDNLVIRDSQDQIVSTLCYDETVNVLTLALRFLIFSCTKDRRGGRPELDGQPNENQQQAELLLLNLILSAVPYDPGYLGNQIETAFTWLGIEAGAEVQRVQWLRQFVTAMSQAYPIIAVVPYDTETHRVSVSYRRTTMHALPRRDRRTQLRLILGLRPIRVRVNTALAQVSKSYHLHVLGPGSQYLMEQTLSCPSCGGTLTRAGIVGGQDDGGSHTHRDFSLAKKKPYFELRGKRGQAYAHLYMRGFTYTSGETLILSTSFGETPPGTLASATITAAMSCLLIAAVGHAQLLNISHGSDIPPLLLALPAAAASWFGYASDSEAMLRSSLAARCSLVLGGVVSLVGSVVFLITNRAQSGPQPATVPSLLGLQLTSCWNALFLVAVANLLYIVTQLVVRTSSYRRLLLRREPDGYRTASQKQP
jgi:hypothetical protein